MTNDQKAILALTRENAALAARLAEALSDIEAYRGALGYPVPADHDGRLSDGTTPICGLCDARSRAADSAPAVHPLVVDGVRHASNCRLFAYWNGRDVPEKCSCGADREDDE